MAETWWPTCKHCREPLNKCSCADLNVVESSAILATISDNPAPTISITARVVGANKIVVSSTTQRIKFV